MAQEENHIQVVLAELLAEDRQLLGRKDELIEKLSEKIGVEYKRDFTPLRNALRDNDIGEWLLVADNGTPEDKEAAEAKVLASLSNIQESRAKFVVETLIGAMGWNEDPSSEPEPESVELDEEIEDTEEQAATDVKTSWDCVCGCQNNTKNFCKKCGKAREDGTRKVESSGDNTWICSNCGKSGNKGNFCRSCGSPKDGQVIEEGALAQDGLSPNTTPDEPTISMAKADIQAVMTPPPVQATPAAQPVNQPVLQQSPPVQVVYTSGNGGQTQRVIIGVIALLVCVLGFMAYKEFSASSEPASSSGYHSLSKSAPDNSKEKSQPAVKSELSLGGMDLDETMQDMYDKLGKESYTKSDDGRTYYYYAGSVRVGFTDGKVTSLVSDGDKSTTKHGLHEGSTLQEVLDAYGDSATKFNYDNLVLYEYTEKSIAGRDGILRFAINSQGKVEYISVRIPEAPKVDTTAIGNSAKEAIAAYHKYITNRDYKAAYNLLTPDMQNTMGAYENWTQGFRNTIESRATDLQVSNVQADSAEVSFILVARDRRPGGYEENRFRSTATVVKTGGGWKIATVNNKKI